jgi:uncharacterized protein (DUF983 family)
MLYIAAMNDQPATPAQPDIRPSLGTALKRGLKLKCPNCGKGRLLQGYITPVKQCSVCAEEYGHIRTDDAAPWLTVLIVGHVFIPTILTVEQEATWPMWVSMTLWPALVLALSLIILPWAKALFLSAIWSMRTQGSEKKPPTRDYSRPV